MTDQSMIRIARELIENLTEMPPETGVSYLVPAYNAIVWSAEENHEGDAFFKAIPVIEEEEDVRAVTAAQLRTLLSVLRLALECAEEESATNRAGDRSSPTGLRADLPLIRDT